MIAWPACVAVPPRTAWTNNGMNAIAPNSATPTRNTTTSERAITGVRNRSSGRIGSAVRRSTATNAPSRSTAVATTQTQSAARRFVAERNQQCADAGKQQSGAKPVDLDGGHPARRRIRGGNDRRGQQPERKIQEEHPAPVQVVGHVSADQRPGDRRETPDAAEQRLRARPLGERVQLADDRHAERDDAAGAEALHGARQDQLHHRRRRAAEQRADEKDSDAGQVDPAAAVQIGETAPDRHATPSTSADTRRTPSCNAPGRRASR